MFCFALTTDLKTKLSSNKVIGFNFWGAKYSLRSDLDYLAEGAALASEIGSEVIGVYMGGDSSPSDLYPFNSPQWPSSPNDQPKSLTDLAKLPYYVALFQNPQIKTYVINAYSLATLGIGFKVRHDKYSDVDAAAESKEFSDL